MLMKTKVLFLLLIAYLVTACSPQRWFLVNTNGIMTYNTRTGQFEMIWEWRETPHEVKSDSVQTAKPIY